MSNTDNRYLGLRKSPVLVPGQNWETRIQPDPLTGAPLLSVGGNPYGGLLTTAPNLLAPVAPGNPLFWFDAQDIDLIGNSSTQRPVVVTVTDNVTSGTHAWVFANGQFTQADVGRILQFSGSLNAANNAQFTIASVTNATTIVTNGTQVTETFSTTGFLANVIGPGAGLQDGSVVSAWLNKGAFLTGGAPVHAIRSAGNLLFRKQWASGRAGNLSSVYSDGSGRMATAAIAALATPCTIAIVCSFESLAPSGGNFCPIDGVGTGRSGFYVNAATGAIHMIGGGDYQTTNVVGSNQLNALVGVFNGASSFVVSTSPTGLVTSPNGNPSPTAMTGVTLYSFVGAAGAFMVGDIFEVLIYVDGTTPATIQSYLAAKYGAMPQ